MKRVIFFLNLILIIASSFVNAQVTGVNFEDTVYYNADWKKCRVSNARYYRVPVVKNNEHYLVKYFRKDNSPYISCEVLPAKLEYNYSIEPNVAIRDGEYYGYWSNGNVKVHGYMSNDMRVGEWKFYYDDGNLESTQSYYSNQPALYCIDYYKNGGKKLEGVRMRIAYNGDTTYEPHDKWISYYSGNRVYMTQNFYFGNIDGEVVFYDSNGNKKIEGAQKSIIVTRTVNKHIYNSYTGKYNNSEKIVKENKTVKDGKWVYYTTAGKGISAEKTYKDGLLHGPYTILHDYSGNVSIKGQYENGIRTGKWNAYYDSTGKVKSEIEYKNNRGHVVFYDSVYSNVIILEGDLNANGRVGKWTSYYPLTKRIKSEEQYKDNLLQNEATLYDNLGNLHSEISYKNGVKSGKTTYYYKGTKDKWVVMRYENDTLNGEAGTYYADGKNKRKIKYKNGEIISNKCYDQDGKIVNCSPFYTETTFVDDLATYIGKNLEYPVEAKNAKLEGKVKIGCYIDEYGKVKDAIVIEGFDDRCDEEALRLVSMMPNWQPALLEDIPVSSYKVIPVVFWIPSDETLVNTTD